MFKLNYKKRVWIVKQRLKGVSPSKLALSQKVSDRTIRSILSTYNEYGWDGLKDHKTGRPETILNPNAEIVILDLRRYGYGACRIEQILKQKGFSISHRQIEKVLLRNNKIVPNLKKQKSRKWVRYELPNPNDLWHTDWTYDPYTGKNLAAYIDDRTRLVTCYALSKRATSEITIAILKGGISEYGKPKAIMTDHGAQYYANKCDDKHQNTFFRKTLNVLGIKHYLERVNQPQTNGKIERFFLSYKTEYKEEVFSSIRDYMKHYNECRLHMSLNYKTPKQVWDELTNRK